jgi:hypothetical protein
MKPPPLTESLRYAAVLFLGIGVGVFLTDLMSTCPEMYWPAMRTSWIRLIIPMYAVGGFWIVIAIGLLTWSFIKK